MAFDFIGPVSAYGRASYTHGLLFEWAASLGRPLPVVEQIAAAYRAVRPFEVSDPDTLHCLLDELTFLRHEDERKSGGGGSGEVHDVLVAGIEACNEALTVGGSFFMQP